MNTNERLIEELTNDIWAISDGTSPDKDTLKALIRCKLERAAESSREAAGRHGPSCEFVKDGKGTCGPDCTPAEPRQPEVREPFYHLAQTEDGCHTCAAGEMWTFEWMEDGEPTQPGESWDDKEFVENLIEYLNDAYEAGHVAARGSSGIASGRVERCQAQSEECGQCELCEGHEGKHLAGYLLWGAAAGKEGGR